MGQIVLVTDQTYASRRHCSSSTATSLNKSRPCNEGSKCRHDREQDHNLETKRKVKIITGELVEVNRCEGRVLGGELPCHSGLDYECLMATVQISNVLRME